MVQTENHESSRGFLNFNNLKGGFMNLKSVVGKDFVTKADLAEILYEYIKYKPKNSQSCWNRNEASNKELIKGYEDQKILGRFSDYSDAQYEYSFAQMEFIKSYDEIIRKTIKTASDKMSSSQTKAVAIQQLVNGFESKEDLFKAINMVSSEDVDSSKIRFIDKNTVDLIYNVIMSKKDPSLKPIALKGLHEKISLKTDQMTNLEKDLITKKYESDKVKEFDQTLINQIRDDLLYLNEKKKEVEQVKDQEGKTKEDKPAKGTTAVKVVKKLKKETNSANQVDKKPKAKEF